MNRVHAAMLAAAIAAVASSGGCHVIFGIDEVAIHDAPPTADGPPDTGRWLAVATGYAHTCAIASDHAAWCWGSNTYGALGTGSPAGFAGTPQQVSGVAGVRFVAITAGDYFTCALADDHTAWCWGYNLQGQLGIDNFEAQSLPVKIPGAWSAIAASTYHVCALDAATSALSCWGYNNVGQLGDGSTTNRARPTLVDSAAYAIIAPGQTFTCAMRADTTTLCWGWNAAGQLGDKISEPMSLVPVPGAVTSDGPWQSLSSGYDNACGVTTAGKLRCWGSNTLGDLGDGSMALQSLPVAVLDPGGVDRTDWTSVTVGQTHACARRTDGTVWCWGDDRHGELAQPLTTTLVYAPQMLPTAGTTWASASASTMGTCALATGGALSCTGSDGNGELGDGGTSLVVPTSVGATATRVIAAGQSTCIVDANGLVSCAGENNYGQLGDGATTDRGSFAPVALSTLPGFTGGTVASFGLGATHGCATSPTNSIACWGSNLRGEAGIGGATPSGPQMPTLVPSGALTSIAAGSAHTCGIASGGDVYCWGANDYLQTGAVGAAEWDSPTIVPVIGAAVIATGGFHTCAIGSTTAVTCWGHGTEGEVGTGAGSAIAMAPPATIPGLTATAIALGQYSSYAIDTSQQGWAWGYNYAGQLGVGDTTNRYAPTKLPQQWKAIAAGDAHACGIDVTGALWCWGQNDRGQLGDGTLSDRLDPEAIATGKTWVGVAAGSHHTCAIGAADGSLWCWGANDWGQLANGDAWRARWVSIP